MILMKDCFQRGESCQLLACICVGHISIVVIKVELILLLKMKVIGAESNLIHL